MDSFSGFLKKMSHLKIIRLQNNNLTYVPKDAFAGLRSLDHIDLTNNSIATIEENPYANLPECDSTFCVRVRFNPLICNCSLVWLRKFANSIKGDKSCWKCAQPQKILGKSLISLKVREMCSILSGTNAILQCSISNIILMAAVIFCITVI